MNTFIHPVNIYFDPALFNEELVHIWRLNRQTHSQAVLAPQRSYMTLETTPQDQSTYSALSKTVEMATRHHIHDDLRRLGT